MMAGLQNLKKKLNGQETISQKSKMRFIIVSVLLTHLLLVELFSIYYVFPLFVYNVLLIQVYVVFFSRIRNSSAPVLYFLPFCELGLHAVIATILVGWNAGFGLYILLVVPISFYMIFSFPKLKNRLYIPVLITFFAFVSFLALYLLMTGRTVIYEMEKSGIVLLYLFNTLVIFIMLGFLSLCFILETMDQQQRLSRQNESLGEIANVDPLTGLLNRRCVERYLDEAMERAKQKGTLFSIIIGDIDNFKRINDTYGHECGDFALVHVADMMKQGLRGTDVVSRWGGEEFLLLVQGNTSVAVAAAERVREAIETNVISYNNVKIPFTMTFGVSTYEPGFKMETIIKQADDHLYEGKTSGKNKVVAIR